MTDQRSGRFAIVPAQEAEDLHGSAHRSSTPILRPYQRDHVSRTYEEIAAGRRRILQVAPTGAGKTVTGSAIMRKMVGNSRRLTRAHARGVIRLRRCRG